MAIVYFHIGAPKTATSTLQHVLARNYGRLLKAGVLYPREIMHGNAHHALVCDFLEKYRGQSMPDIWYGNVPRGQSWQLLRSEIERHHEHIHSVVVSSELFFGQVHNLEVMLHGLVTHLQGHEVRVVVYLRPQDQLYSSFYNQDVKGIRQWSHNAYQFYQTHQIFEYDYHTILNMWSDSIGRENLIVRAFEAEQWPEKSIVKDFASLFGNIPLKEYKAQNSESLGMVQLYVKRCLNKVGFDKQNNEEVLKVLYQICPEVSEKGCSYIHRALYKKYREKWIEDNLAVSNNYLSSRELFIQPIPSADEATMYELDRFGIALYVRNMFHHFEHNHNRKYRRLFSKATLLVMAEQNLWNALDAVSRLTVLEWATTIE